MERRTFLRTAGVISTLGLTGVGTVSANGTALVNATVTPSGAIVATDDDFVVAGQNITVDTTASTYYQDANDVYVVYNDGYSGVVCDNTVTATETVVGGLTSAICVEGGVVDVRDNAIVGNHGGNTQFGGVTLLGGATATVSGNSITGSHRVGVLARGTGTEVEVSGNDIVGPGPRTAGWADNGVQIDQGATGIVRDNLVADHWYAPNSFVSSGLLGFADDLTVLRNRFTNNDLAVGVAGDRNNHVRNEILVDLSDPVASTTTYYGIYELGGEDNGLRQNEVTAAATVGVPEIGVIVLGENAKLVRNDISGWNTPIADFGTDTKLPPPFLPN